MKLGIFGGCFDPIHYGHLLLMERAIEIAELTAVMLVPTFDPPHGKIPETSFEHRTNMTDLALSDRDDDRVRVSVLEEDLPRPSYTVNTLSRIHEVLKDNVELFLIMGGDEYASFPNWKNPHSIVEMAQLVVVNRAGSSLPTGTNPEFMPFVAEEVSEISSTNIRKALAEGRSIRYMTPEPVREYIEEYGLYQWGLKNEN